MGANPSVENIFHEINLIKDENVRTIVIRFQSADVELLAVERIVFPIFFLFFFFFSEAMLLGGVTNQLLDFYDAPLVWVITSCPMCSIHVVAAWSARTC